LLGENAAKVLAKFTGIPEALAAAFVVDPNDGGEVSSHHWNITGALASSLFVSPFEPGGVALGRRDWAILRGTMWGVGTGRGHAHRRLDCVSAFARTFLQRVTKYLDF